MNTTLRLIDPKEIIGDLDLKKMYKFPCCLRLEPDEEKFSCPVLKRKRVGNNSDLSTNFLITFFNLYPTKVSFFIVLSG